MSATYGSISSKHCDDGLDLETYNDEILKMPHRHHLTKQNSSTESSHDSQFYFSSVSMWKVISVASLIVFLLQNVSVNAWTMPKNHLWEKAITVGTIAAALASAPINVNAVDFSGSYADPFHQNCIREVQVITPSLADVSGTDGNPACPPDGSGRKWSLVGKIDGDSILIDFTPKGGPKDLKGVWEPSPVPGIRFPDGNLWSKKATVQ